MTAGLQLKQQQKQFERQITEQAEQFAKQMGFQRAEAALMRERAKDDAKQHSRESARQFLLAENTLKEQKESRAQEAKQYVESHRALLLVSSARVTSGGIIGGQPVEIAITVENGGGATAAVVRFWQSFQYAVVRVPNRDFVFSDPQNPEALKNYYSNHGPLPSGKSFDIDTGFPSYSKEELAGLYDSGGMLYLCGGVYYKTNVGDEWEPPVKYCYVYPLYQVGRLVECDRHFAPRE